MLAMISDPYVADQLRKDRKAAGLDKYDEVWDGVTVVMPLPNTEHQELVGGLMYVLAAVFGWPNSHRLLPGINLSDRHPDWKENFREPDYVVYLQDNPAKNYGSHWVGGPDFAVEIVSPDDTARDKLPFYAKVGTKEVLIIDRYPWRLELYQLQGDRMVRTALVKPDDEAVAVSGPLPVTFGLKAGEPRPTIVVTHKQTGQEWLI